jgi:hypothetical protein
MNDIYKNKYIVDSIFTTGERPVIFCRTINDDDS